MKLLIVFIIFISFQTLCYGTSLTFDLFDYNPINTKTHSQIKFYNLTDFNTEIHIVSIPKTVGFYIVQVHSYLENVTLSSTEIEETQTFVRGTNIGLVGLGTDFSTFYLSTDIRNISVLLAVTIYGTDDPIPGGCNLSFNTAIAPYQLVSYTDELIIIKSQAASMKGIPCEINVVRSDLYHMYLTENDRNPTEYFNALKSMLTVDDIKLNGRKVNTFDGYFKYNKFYSSYRGTGQVFAIIASFNNNQTSAYVPIISYGCDVKIWGEDCVSPVTTHFKFISVFLLIFGLLICLLGHSFYKVTSCLIAIASGFFITYTLLSLSEYFSVNDKTLGSAMTGLWFSVFWIFIVLRQDNSILTVSLTFSFAAFLTSAIIFYAGLADEFNFTSDFNYWGLTIIIIVIYFLFAVIFSVPIHIFSCSLLGSYAFITALNYYIGGNLQYIFINIYRRIIIKNFHTATIDPPYQSLDIIQTIIWLFLIGFGSYCQWRSYKRRPLFQSFINRFYSHFIQHNSDNNENTCLLRNERLEEPSV